MKNLRILFLVAFALIPCSLLADSSSLADSSEGMMASILAELNHFPSDAQKEVLAAIYEDASNSPAEKLVAAIISRVAHQVGDADKAELQTILGSEEVSEGLKTIANAILNIKHKVQSDDLQALKKLIDS